MNASGQFESHQNVHRLEESHSESLSCKLDSTQLTFPGGGEFNDFTILVFMFTNYLFYFQGCQGGHSSSKALNKEWKVEFYSSAKNCFTKLRFVNIM